MATSTKTTLRTKLLASVGLGFVAALVSIGIYAYRTADHDPARESTLAEVTDCYEWEVPPITSGFWDAVGQGELTRSDMERIWRNLSSSNQKFIAMSDVYGDDLACTTEGNVRTIGFAAHPASTTYESNTITTSLIASTIAAVVLAAATLIWTRSKDRELVTSSSREASNAEAVDGLDREGDAESQPTGVPSDPQDLLRSLQALRAEGLLTEDEYEAKRQVAVERL